MAAVADRTQRYWFVIGYLIMLVALLVSLYQLRSAVNEQKRISMDTNSVVKKEVPRLEAENAELTFMLNEQAVPAIIAMLGQIEAAGGKPPKVLISPTQPPFVEQQPKEG